MSNHKQPEPSWSSDEFPELQAQLDQEGSLEREEILAEAQALAGFPGEDQAHQALLDHMQSTAAPASPPRHWGGLIGGLLAVAAAAALLFMLQDRGSDPKTLDVPNEAQRFALDGAEKLEILQPLGAVSEYGSFSWRPTGSVDLSATLRIWDDTPAGVGKPPLEWKGITDNELPFRPEVELPAKIRWSVELGAPQSQPILRSEDAFAELRP